MIGTTLWAGTIAYITLPDDKVWEDDVDDWYVKWDTLHYKFKDETEWREMQLNSDIDDIIDWKRPQSATVYDEDNNDIIDERD